MRIEHGNVRGAGRLRLQHCPQVSRVPPRVCMHTIDSMQIGRQEVDDSREICTRLHDSNGDGEPVRLCEVWHGADSIPIVRPGCTEKAHKWGRA